MTPSQTQNLSRPAAWLKASARWLADRELVLVAIAAPFLLFPSRWTLPAFGLVCLAWIARAATLGRLSLPSASDLPLALLLLATLVSFYLSPDRAMSRAKLWGIILQIALFYATLNSLVRPGRGPRGHTISPSAFGIAALVLVALTLGIALLGLVGTDWASARFLNLPQIYDRLPRLIRGLPGSGVPVASDLFSPREVGATLAMLLPVPVALLLFAARPLCGRDRLLRWLSLAALLLGSFAFILCESIQAAAGLAVALLLIAIWRSRWALLAVPLGLLGLAGGLYAYGPQRAALALLSAEHPLGAGVVLRLDIWSRAWAMVSDAPFTGVGINTYPVVQTHFYPGYLLGAEPNAHQLFLGTAVDLGLPGLLALLWLLAAFGVTVVRAYRVTPERDLRVLLVGLAAGALAYVVHGLVDTVSLGAKPVAALFLMFGLAAALWLRGQPAPHKRTADPPALEQPRHGPRAVAALRPILPLVGFLLLLAVFAAAAPATPHLNLGVVRAHQALVEARTSHVPPVTELQAAVEPLQQAIARDPESVYAYGHLGSLYAWLGDYPAAVAALEARMALDGQGPAQRYAPWLPWLRRLQGQEPPDPWEDLLSVYEQWQNRYPDRAEGYAQTALVLARHRGDAARARDVLQEGLDRGAEPRALLSYTLAQLQGQP